MTQQLNLANSVIVQKMIADELQNCPSIEYKIIEKIAKGSYGQVYKSVTGWTKKSVAIKVMTKRSTNENEISIINSLLRFKKSKKYFPRYYHIFEQDLKYYVVMEYLKGFHYNKSYFDEYIYNLKDCLQLVKRILKIINFMHKNKFIINDFKGDNIIIDYTMRPKMIDFGLVNYMNLANDADSQKGTPTFLPPESFSGIFSGIKKDIWMFAASTYEFLIGQYPIDDLICEYKDENIRKFKFNTQDLPVTLEKMEMLFFTKLNKKFDHDKRLIKLWNILKQCLNEKFEKRPSVDKILRYVSNGLSL